MSSKGIAVVTGGAGFIGRHLVIALIKAGFAVRVLDPKAEGLNFPKGVKVFNRLNFKFVRFECHPKRCRCSFSFSGFNPSLGQG